MHGFCHSASTGIDGGQDDISYATHTIYVGIDINKASKSRARMAEPATSPFINQDCY